MAIFFQPLALALLDFSDSSLFILD